jgi:hypothetical protein
VQICDCSRRLSIDISTACVERSIVRRRFSHAGHFHAAREHFTATSAPILVLHDTTEFSYKREDIEAVGKTRLGIAGTGFAGRPRHYTACGINPTRVPIEEKESVRWLDNLQESSTLPREPARCVRIGESAANFVTAIKSIGDSSPICSCFRVHQPSRRFDGMRCAGRSRHSTRF